MIYNDFNEVEISFKKDRRGKDNGTWWDRAHIVSLNQVSKYYGKKDTFISSARFKDLKKYVNSNNNKVAGFDGELYYDFLIIDIDKINIKQVLLFLEHLDINYDIPKDILRIYFSGSKGFHILIPSTIFDLKPSATLNLQVRKIVEELCSNVIEFDGTLYDKLQAYRLRCTLHSSSNLYKTPINYSDLSRGAEYIKTLAKRKAIDFVYPEYPVTPIPHLAEMVSNFGEKRTPIGNGGFLEPTEFQGDDYQPFRKLCIYKMLQGTTEHEDDGSPGRSETGIRLAVHFKKEKFGREYTEAIMNTWNSLNKPPLSEANIQEMIRNAYKSSRYDYGCKDPVHKFYCDMDCFLFKGRD